MEQVLAERAFCEFVANKPDSARADYAALLQHVHDSRWFFGGEPVPTSLKPHFLPRALCERWGSQVQAIHCGLEHIAQGVLGDDETTMGLLGFDTRGRELLRIDPGYGHVAPLARADMVWRGSRATMIELNADSPAMMTFGDGIHRWLLDNLADEVLEGVAGTPPRRTALLGETLRHCYREWGGVSSSPTIAIVDFPGVKTYDEQKCTASELESLGLESIVCHPHQLSIHSGKLHALGRQVDVVYRRVLFSEFLSRTDEVATLLEAYRRGIVCMVNPLRSYLLGTKAALGLLFAGDMDSYLSTQQREAIREALPPTVLVDDHIRNVAKKERNRWVLKPAVGSGGSGVTLGPHCSDQEWNAALEASRSNLWVAQEICPIPRVSLPAFDRSGTLALEPFYANWNPFLFGGRYAGAITRAGTTPIVSIHGRGALLPVIEVEEGREQAV